MAKKRNKERFDIKTRIEGQRKDRERRKKEEMEYIKRLRALNRECKQNAKKKIEEAKANLFNRKKLNSVVLKNERIKGEENIAIFNNMIHKENVMKRIVIQCEDIKVREAVSKALV